MTPDEFRKTTQHLVKKLADLGETKLALQVIWLNYRIHSLQIDKKRHNRKVEKLTAEAEALNQSIIVAVTKIRLK